MIGKERIATQLYWRDKNKMIEEYEYWGRSSKYYLDVFSLDRIRMKWRETNVMLRDLEWSV